MEASHGMLLQECPVSMYFSLKQIVSSFLYNLKVEIIGIQVNSFDKKKKKKLIVLTVSFDN